MTSMDALHALKKEFPETLKQCYGNITLACAKMGISRKTYYNWWHNDEAFKEECLEADIYAGDFVESKLLKAIGEDNITAIIFYCKTKLRKRGYIEMKEIEQSEKSIQYVITPQDNEIFKAQWLNDVADEVQKQMKILGIKKPELVEEIKNE